MNNIWYKIESDIIDLRKEIEYIGLLPAAEITIKSIMQDYEPPYHLMLSGGLDSMAMLDLWNKFGKNFVPTHVRYNGDMNKYDFASLKEYIKKTKNEINFIDFDILSFYQNQYHDFAIENRCLSPQFAAHLYFSKDLPGTVIFSGDRIERKFIGIQPSVAIADNNMCVYEFSKKRSMVPYFFLHSAELAYSKIGKYILRPESYRYNHDYKFDLFRLEGLDLVKPEEKYSGFEKVKKYYDVNFSVNEEVKIKYRKEKNLPKKPRNFDIILRYPYEEIFGLKEYKYFFNKFNRVGNH